MPLRRNSTLMVPQVYASYQHEFFDNTWGLDPRLSQGGSTFTWQTNQPQRDFAVVGANCTISQGHLTIQLDYNTEVGRSNYTAHNVNAEVRWQF
jgi:outer membrane autotransporter protein